MKNSHTTLLLLTVALASGCQSDRVPSPLTGNVPKPPDLASACTAESLRFGQGRTISTPLLEEMRIRTGARIARTLPVGDPQLGAPTDPTRLTVEVDKAGRVVAAQCA